MGQFYVFLIKTYFFFAREIGAPDTSFEGLCDTQNDLILTGHIVCSNAKLPRVVCNANSKKKLRNDGSDEKKERRKVLVLCMRLRRVMGKSADPKILLSSGCPPQEPTQIPTYGCMYKRRRSRSDSGA